IHGTLAGTGNLIIRNTADYDGTMIGTGVLTIRPTGRLKVIGVATPTLLARPIENYGTLELYARNWDFAGAVVTNHSQMLVDASSFPTNVRGISGTNAIINYGVVTKIGSSARTFMNNGASLAMDNYNIMRVNEGTLQINSG